MKKRKKIIQQFTKPFIRAVLFFKVLITNLKNTLKPYVFNVGRILVFASATAFLLYWKPFLVIPFYLLFAVEYFYICKYLNIIYTKKTQVYKVIDIKKLNYLPQSTFTVWKEICKINAFLKVYKIFYKKKINFWGIVRILIIYLLGIPYKIIYVIKKIIFAKGPNLYQRLLFIYVELFDQTKALKIEIFYNTVYLNCYNLKNFVHYCRSSIPNLDKGACSKLIQTLSFHQKEFLEHENKSKEYLDTYMSQIETIEGVSIPFTHPTYYWHLKLHRNELLNNKFSIHATSNAKVKLTPTQIKGEPINNFIKENSKFPGTIITINPKIKTFDKFRPLTKLQVDTVLWNEKDAIEEIVGWELLIDNHEYLAKKKIIIEDIIKSFDTTNRAKTKEMSSQITQSLWDFALTGHDGVDLINAIENEYENT